jgi:hypothetical protein
MVKISQRNSVVQQIYVNENGKYKVESEGMGNIEPLN